MKRDGTLPSLWQETVNEHHLVQRGANKDFVFDVVIAGGGITGITTGLLLQKAGKSVLIAEAHNIGFGTTGGTTAHLNTFLDTPYFTLQKNFGEKEAQTVATAVHQSLELIKRNIEEYNIDCEYHQLPAFLFSQTEEQSAELEKLQKSAQECNVACEWTDSIPSPIPFIKALKWEGQASFHPLRYLQGIAKAFEDAGGIILENCRVTAVDEGAELISVQTCIGELTARHFIYATHIPPGVNLLHFRCAPYRSYAMAVELETKDDYPDALLYDMYDPYHYYRTQQIDGKKYFIAGGEDHKTGHEENTEQCFRRLEAHVRNHYSIEEVSNKWSSQYYEPVDGLPYIGHLPGHAGNMYVATGYSGNGMAYSGVAALLLTDIIAGSTSDWEELFDPNRIKMVAGFSNFVKEAADVVGHLIKTVTLPTQKIKDLADLAAGEARIIKYEGHKMALYKDEQGELHALHSACTHIKCDVSWNSAEKTWDCPCHGSRFSYTGEVLNAPARKDLGLVEISPELAENAKHL